MDIARSGHLGSLLVCGILCLAMLICLVMVLKNAFGRLRAMPRRGLDLAGLAKDTLAAAALSVFAAGLLLGAIAGLVHWWPAAGNVHPWVTAGLRVMGDPKRTLEGLARGLDKGDVSLVQLALGMGAHPDQVPAPPALVRTRDPAIRQLLLDHGAAPDGGPDQGAPLHAAAAADDLDSFRWLLEHGSRRGLVATGDAPLPVQHVLALRGASTDWLEVLLASGADFLSATDASGASLADVLQFKAAQSPWLPRLRAAGAGSALPMMAPELDASHPAVTAGLAWLQTDRRVPRAGGYTPDETVLRDLPARDLVFRSARGTAGTVLVWADLGAVSGDAVVLHLRGQNAEASNAAEAESPVAPADAGARTWQVIGAWLPQQGNGSTARP